MIRFWKNNKKFTDVKAVSVAKEQLDKNRAVLESLKEYDEGKKTISTTNVKRHLQDLQPTL